jgi:hypothetical protein
VTTYQTLEHVQDLEAVLREMVRVTKVGGGIYIRCPDYRSTFEAHYQLPWLPLLPRWLAERYLKALNRPVEGLNSINYVTPSKIKKLMSAQETGALRVQVIDDSRVRFENILRRSGVPLLPGLYEAKVLAQWLAAVFRRELSVNMFIRILAK